jgi:hypothetical protein
MISLNSQEEMMIEIGRSQPGRRVRRAVVVTAVAAVGLASSAWACVPATPDKQTKVASCNPPPAATKPCKTPVGAPTFPNATFVKGPSGSTLSAYVNGPGLASGIYDLVFATRPQLENGNSWGSATSAVIGGPVMTTSGGISATTGTIPASSPLGLSQICFTTVNRPATSVATSTPAQFKVTI